MKFISIFFFRYKAGDHHHKMETPQSATLCIKVTVQPRQAAKNTTQLAEGRFLKHIKREKW